MNIFRNILLATSVATLLAPTAQAGHEVASSDGKSATTTTTARVREWFPDDPRGMVTLGTQFSSHLNGVYLDSITGIWAPQKRDAFLFLDSRYHYEDNAQFISSTGLAFRKLLPEKNVIIGVNAFGDSISSERDNNFEQLGLGAEILTQWIDARFNYYLPENDQVQVGSSTDRRTSHGSGTGLTTTTTTNKFVQREAALKVSTLKSACSCRSVSGPKSAPMPVIIVTIILSVATSRDSKPGSKRDYSPE